MSRKLPLNVANFTKLQFEAFLRSFDTVLTDCDGVLWKANDVLKSANIVINRLVEMNKKVYFITNNSTKTRDELAEKAKMLNFNVGFVSFLKEEWGIVRKLCHMKIEENMISTAYLAAQFLKQRNFTKKVYVMGSSGIAKELDLVGIRHYGVGPDVLQEGPILAAVQKSGQYKDPEVGAVIVGFDEHISFPKLMKAASYLDDKSTIFLATNTDERFPMPNYVVPGTGTMVRAVETCSERKAIIMGKPENYLCDIFFGDEVKKNSQRFLMIGDRLNTDILFGKNNNFQTLLVETGVHKLDKVQEIINELDSGLKDIELENQIPHFYLSALGDLFNNYDA